MFRISILGFRISRKAGMGVKGIDGKHALLKMGRAHLCVKRKKPTAKEDIFADLRAFAREQLEGVIATNYSQNAPAFAFAG